MILPGKTIGVLGGGQLGRMLAQAAQTMGYRVHIFEPQSGCPAGAVANREINASYDDVAALTEFARGVDVVTYEFENIPSAPLAALAALVPLHPRAEVLHICQNRQREKAWLRANQFPHVRYAEALDGDIVPAVAQVGRPCVVKTADFGYDGKGQMRIVSETDLEQAAAIFRGRRCVVERWVDFKAELSVIVARGATGEQRAFPVAENIHTRHILDVTLAPARFGEAVLREAEHVALAIAERLEVVGLLAVEMFLSDKGEVLVNELAPRPHNSGHWTIDGCETSQFEQHVRAVCGLPLGAVDVRSPTVMGNILGDAWGWDGDKIVGEPDWLAVLREPRAKLHLYGKREPRRGRKMGHFTVRAASVEAALAGAERVKASLRTGA
ncbi:5-(carboxyamino)imidazole ribonucleotide synthase [Horticoccus luteus]|uniref:N5-carboxyaminoimidazole ribonucleotide synthase n=1 Tax=Horticoccus luteus TaxID=2862869 RepID=A0A8F9XLW8_9BACT|nr:5-(carboxyamino)imidazole ribonucleotide synthase [Horticoccus luteus]QYM79449.1 5-(carboxyamino)imidazole ribonucleotide synthase [Horticoccus luteus]